jgi:hypothetical protein
VNRFVVLELWWLLRSCSKERPDTFIPFALHLLQRQVIVVITERRFKLKRNEADGPQEESHGE